MGFFDKFKTNNPTTDTKAAVNIDWILQKLDEIGVTNKASIGFALSLPNETTTTKHLRQDGQWQVPPDTDTMYTHPTHTAQSSGLYKITVDSLGHVSAVTAVTKADITGLGIPGSDTTYAEMSGTTLVLVKLNGNYTFTGIINVPTPAL
jgi:hypothetical protein